MNKTIVKSKHQILTQPTIVFLILVLLTLLSAYLGEFSEWNTTSLIVVLVIMVAKAQLIIDYFMQLKGVQRIWRISMSCFSIVIALIAFLILR